jgi:hypothetical protein
MMIRWQIFATQETHACVQVLSKQLGISPGELVRRAIDRELARWGEFRQVPSAAQDNSQELVRLATAEGAAPGPVTSAAAALSKGDS